MRQLTWSFGLIAYFAVPGFLVAGAIVDFEGLPDGTILSTQYPGLTFSNAIILTAGISLNEFEFPPFSGFNVASDNGGPITIPFASPITTFGGYFTHLGPLTLRAFDIANAQVGLTLSLFSNNLALSGDPGSAPNELLQLFAGGISSITITGDPAGGSFTLDNATTGAVPEPATFSLLLAGSTIVVALRNRRK